ncbi:22890_t:CDS:2, partial [Gigaspora rosea]
KASAFKNGLSIAVNAALAATIVQISFREILDEQFITEAVQKTYQQKFMRFKFIPNWNDENSYDKYMNKFEELKMLANYQYATNFKSGLYTDYKMRLPPEIKERLTLQAGLGNVQTKTQFWQQTSAIFHSLRQNKNNTESQVPRDNTNQSEAFGQSSTKITSSHPLERLEVPPLTRKNKPATGTQRDHKNHKPNHNQLHATGDHTVGRLSQVQGAQQLVPIRQTYGAQRASTNNHDRQRTLQNSNHDKSIIMTINKLEKEIEQYVKRADQRSAKKHDQQTTVQINTIKPTKKYPVHKEQKDIREKTLMI